MEQLAQLIVLTLAAGTPLVYAALGELVVEKSGVLNLGVEGMMVVGAVTSFIVAATTHSPWLGVAAGMAAGTALSLIFGVLTLSLMANQVAAKTMKADSERQTAKKLKNSDLPRPVCFQ